MKYPAFVQEMAAEANRRKLFVGIWSGYITAAGFGGLALIAQLVDLIPWSASFYTLVAIKLITNTIAWVSLYRRTLVLETAGLNLIADVVVLTGAIYLTGAQISPLFAIYVIEIAVVAMLSNRGVTIMTAIGAVLAYLVMSVMVHTGALPAHPPPIVRTGGITDTYVIVDLTVKAALLGALTYYTTAMLRVLRGKERALESKTRALIEADAHKAEFTTNVTHELLTPIHGVLGLTELLESDVYGPLTAKQRAAVASIGDNAQGLLHLVDDLLALARSESGSFAPASSRFDVRELVERTVSSVRWMQGRKQLSIEVDVADDLPPIETDRDAVGRIVTNLLSNAIKFTPEAGSVRVFARLPDAGTLELGVVDSGIGIPEHELPHIFEPFRQVDGSTSRRFGGAGIGLSLVKKLTEALGGRVEVQSSRGAGTRFTVRLPLS